MSSWQRTTTMAVVASLGVHLVALRAAPLFAPPALSPPPVSDVLFFELAVRANEQPALERVVSEPAPREPPAQPASPAHASARARARAQPESLAVDPEPEPASAHPNVAPSEPAGPRPSPREVTRRDLSPRAAAATLAGELRRDDTTSCSALRLADRDRGCGDLDVGQVRDGAARAGRASATRPAMPRDFPLEPERGGGYVYETFFFEAHILPDGQVRFRDLILDLNGLASSLAGEYQNASEKRRFIEQSAALRAYMSQKFIAEAQARGLVALRRKLMRIVAGSVSPERKREAVFTLWDDCAGDALGHEAQSVIEAFIRAEMPQDGPLAYSLAELNALNARRTSRRAFAPYAAGG